MLVYPVLASFLLSNGPLQRPGSQGVGGRSALTTDPWSDILRQNGKKRGVLPTARASWSRPGRDLAPETVLGRIVIDFGVVFGRFGEDFGPVWMDFHDFCSCEHDFNDYLI